MHPEEVADDTCEPIYIVFRNGLRELGGVADPVAVHVWSFGHENSRGGALAIQPNAMSRLCSGAKRGVSRQIRNHPNIVDYPKVRNEWSTSGTVTVRLRS